MAAAYEKAIIRLDNAQWRCSGQPPAWAELRAHMVRPAQWFHNEQSGFAHEPIVRQTNQTYPATGLLLSKWASPRSYIDVEILITSINGRESLDTPETRRRREAMQHAIDQKRMIGVILEQGAMVVNPQWPIPFFPGNDMPKNITCVILGWFLPIEMWPEKVPDTNPKQAVAGAQWMVKLQKNHLEQRSWWSNPAHPHPPPLQNRNFGPRAARQLCSHCGQTSIKMFQEHFVCLNNDCQKGCWRLDGKVIPASTPLTYATDFLKERIDTSSRSMVPTGPAPYPRFYMDFTQWLQNEFQTRFSQPLTADNYRENMSLLLTSFCCPNCNMMNLRDDWVQWRCRNSECHLQSPSGTNFRAQGAPPLISVADATAFDMPHNLRFPRRLRRSPRNMPGGNVDLAAAFAGVPSYQGLRRTTEFEIYSFKFHDECCLEYMLPQPGTNQLPGGADFLYRRLQELALDGTLTLRRRSTVSGGGVHITNHFSQNFGTPYLMDVSVDTMTFSDAPPEIEAATHMVDKWTNKYRNKTDPQFNQMYIGGYFYGQRMGYHTDGEVDLDDKIGTMSLGGQGVFSVAINARIYQGFHTRGPRRYLRNDPVVQGCYKYAERLAMKQRLDNGEITQDQWQAHFDSLVGVPPRFGRSDRKLLDLPTTHGCYILMHGKLMQRYFEHTMEVSGVLRFALTFRHIGQANYSDQTKLDRNNRRVAADEQFVPQR